MARRNKADIISRLEDLYIQATRERSHYYTGIIIKEALMEIIKLREEVLDLQTDRIALISDLQAKGKK
jgi:hypothetical protein